MGVVVFCFGFMRTYSDILTTTVVFGFFAPGFHAHTVTVLAEIVPRPLIADFIAINVFLLGSGTLVVSILGG